MDNQNTQVNGMLSVCVYLLYQVLSGGGLYSPPPPHGTWGGCMSRGVLTQPPDKGPGIQRDTVGKRAVRILLECFLVLS